MKIKSVETFVLQHQLKKPFGVSVSVPYGTTRDSLIVKITTDEGIIGWGETAVISGARGTLVDSIAPSLIGKNPLDRRQLWADMYGENFGNALSVAAVDIALHDIAGKALNVPIHQLYGGKVRDKVLAYASAMNYTEGLDPLKQFPEEASALVQKGFKAMKCRIGRLEPKQDLKIMEAVRQAIGPDIRFMTDANGAYTLPTAVMVGKELEKLGLYFFEEPLPLIAPHYPAYERLTADLDIRIAGGEALDSRHTGKNLIDRRAVDLIQPDVTLCGGIAECLFIAELARVNWMQCVPHCWGGAIALAATLQVLALIPEDTVAPGSTGPMLELDVYDNPFREQLITHPFAQKDGFVAIPNGPGLGVEVDERVIARYAKK
jgi:D-galactarolactone cycloisomerase